MLAVRAKIALTVLCTAVQLQSGVSRAEWFGDLYGGIAFSERTTADFSNNLTGTFASVPFDIGGSAVVGARGGRWWGPFGLAADVSYFKRKASNGTIDVIPISALVLLRAPLYKSEDHPDGRLQPYAGGGLSFVVGNASMPSVAPGIEAVDKFRADFGFDVRAGVAWRFTKRVGLFSEYRFTAVNFGFTDRKCLQASCPSKIATDITAETKVSMVTHQILFGLRYTF